MADDLPLLTFRDAAALEQWLSAQPPDAPGAWLRFAKKGAAESTVTKSEAIDCALAHGWIDGQLGKADEGFFKARFTPRRPKSIWSQVNRERVEALRAAGRMTAAGEAQVEAAKADGRWAAAYAPASTVEAPEAFLQALSQRPAARAFFEALDGANRYAVLFRLQQASPAKQPAKIAELVDKLDRGETFHPRKTPR